MASRNRTAYGLLELDYPKSRKRSSNSGRFGTPAKKVKTPNTNSSTRTCSEEPQALDVPQQLSPLIPCEEEVIPVVSASCPQSDILAGSISISEDAQVPTKSQPNTVAKVNN